MADQQLLTKFDIRFFSVPRNRGGDMSRKIQKKSLQSPVFLDKASSVSERAARAMCPNGRDSVIANEMMSNVITLQESNLHGDASLVGKNGKFPGPGSQVFNLFGKDGGHDER